MCIRDRLWGDKGDWSKEKRTPVTDKYKPTFKPWIEVVEFENLVPTVVRVTGGDDSATGKPKMYSIAPAFYEQYVRSPEPPSWLEHLQTLHRKESDPPPRKGVQARQRSEPAASKDRSQPSKKPRSTKNKAAPKRARPTLPRQTKIAAVNTTPGQRELLLIQSVQAIHSWASAHGFWRGRPVNSLGTRNVPPPSVPFTDRAGMWCSLLPAGSTDKRSEASAAPRGGLGAPRPLGQAHSGPPGCPGGPTRKKR